MKKLFCHFLLSGLVLIPVTGCNGQTKPNTKTNNQPVKGKPAASQTKSFAEGIDYLVYERVRMMDKQGFSAPQEAYSLLLPKGWQYDGAIQWNGPGSSCDGTSGWMKAASPDGKYSYQQFPDVIYSWAPQSQQFDQNNPDKSSHCSYRKPMDAEAYLRNVFVREELGNAEIIKVEPNPAVVQQMQQKNADQIKEMQQYGAGQMQFYQSAVNATLRWPNGDEGLAVLGVKILEIVVPNPYNGTYNKVYTTEVTKRTLFKYPAGKKEEAKNQFSMIMSSIRTNPVWSTAVNNYWKSMRGRKDVVHREKIRLMDEQTRQMGEAAIRKGNERLKSMDNDMRSWEQQQSSQDRMHTNFIKTIREVENFQDASGKYEMSSSYSNAWSRGDGTTFVMSNNPNFDPGFVFKDQSWKAMKKVD